MYRVQLRLAQPCFHGRPGQRGRRSRRTIDPHDDSPPGLDVLLHAIAFPARLMPHLACEG